MKPGKITTLYLLGYQYQRVVGQLENPAADDFWIDIDPFSSNKDDAIGIDQQIFATNRFMPRIPDVYGVRWSLVEVDGGRVTKTIVDRERLTTYDPARGILLRSTAVTVDGSKTNRLILHAPASLLKRAVRLFWTPTWQVYVRRLGSGMIYQDKLP